MRTTRMVALAAIVACVAFANSTSAKVVVGQSIGGVKLGDSSATALASLGKPKKVFDRGIQDRIDQAVIGQPVPTVHRIIIRWNTYEIMFENDQAVSMSTSNRKEKTSRGVGIGTVDKTLKRKVKGLSCVTLTTARVCSIVNGGIRTSFTLKKGRKAYRVASIGLAKSS